MRVPLTSGFVNALVEPYRLDSRGNKIGARLP